ncbi:MAG: hypothetical protein RLZZ04_1078 [Cyanobacteriota bacterium]|jgi:hypothetical protein
MLKNILRLLAVCASFVALLFVTSPAIASTTVATTEQQLQSPAVNLAVNLNVVSPSLQIAGNTDTLVNHVGCSCAACTQVLR